MNFVLIDGNNLAIRSAFANDFMTNSSGVMSGAHYGFFNSLINLKKKFSDHTFLVVWDSSSKRRKEESTEGVKKGLIRQAYKQNRREGEIPAQLSAWFETSKHLKNALGKAGVNQVTVDGYEADDVIASYCKMLANDNEVVIVSSDKDFYQLLNDNVIIWDGMKGRFFGSGDLLDKHGVNSEQYVDACALMGDSSDNIFGVPGWGPKTSFKAIKESGNLNSFYDDLFRKLSKLEGFDEDLTEEEFNEISEKTTKTGAQLYPEVFWGQKHLGLLKSFDNKKIKVNKKDMMAVIFKERVDLALSLKRMDDDIEGLPDFSTENCNSKDENMLIEYFNYYDIVSLREPIKVFFGER